MADVGFVPAVGSRTSRSSWYIAPSSSSCGSLPVWLSLATALAAFSCWLAMITNDTAIMAKSTSKLSTTNSSTPRRDGCWLLVASCWLLVTRLPATGNRQLATGLLPHSAFEYFIVRLFPTLRPWLSTLDSRLSYSPYIDDPSTRIVFS